MKLAKILIGSPSNQKGAFNNVMSRTMHLMEVEQNVDCYMIRLYYNWIFRLIKGQFKQKKRNEYVVVNGIKFKNLWVKMKPFDYLFAVRLRKRAFMGKKQLEKYITLFKEYDLLSIHGIESCYIADIAKKRYNVPYVSTWHGSDINILPFKNKLAHKVMKRFIENAGHNFFVSKRLLKTSDEITSSKNKSVLYTGPAESFKRFDNKKREKLRKEYGITTKYVVGFIGNIIPIKNVLSLPNIFLHLQIRFEDDISFVIVGDGDLNNKLNQQLVVNGINNIHHLGLQKPDKIPDIMNVLDVLVLPSLNEGLPRVTLEAQACGVHVVGSDRGGIPEVIGSNNCFPLNDSFVENISNRIIEITENNEKPRLLSEAFSWDKAIKKEVGMYRSILDKA